MIRTREKEVRIGSRIGSVVTQSQIEDWCNDAALGGWDLRSVTMHPKALDAYNNLCMGKGRIFLMEGVSMTPVVARKQWIANGDVDLNADPDLDEDQVILHMTPHIKRRELSQMEMVVISRLAWGCTLKFHEACGTSLETWDYVRQEAVAGNHVYVRISKIPVRIQRSVMDEKDPGRTTGDQDGSGMFEQVLYAMIDQATFEQDQSTVRGRAGRGGAEGGPGPAVGDGGGGGGAQPDLGPHLTVDRRS